MGINGFLFRIDAVTPSGGDYRRYAFVFLFS